jgi:hypothetical protein
MSRPVCFALCMIVMISQARRMSGQEFHPLSAGLSYEYGVPWNINRAPGAVDWCPCDGLGRSTDHSASLFGRFDASGLFSERFGLYARLAAGGSAGLFTSDRYPAAPFVDPSSGAIVRTLAEFRVTTRTVFVQGDLACSWSAAPWLSVNAGPWMSYRLAGSFEQREKLLPPAGKSASLPPYDGDQLLAEGDRLASSKLLAGVFVSSSVGLPLSGDLQLSIELLGRLNARAPRTDSFFRALHAGLGVSLRWRGSEDVLPEEISVPVTRPVVRVNAASAEDRLSAGIVMFSFGDKGERIPFGIVRTVQQYFRRKTPLLPNLFFGRNSALIPDRYVQYSSAEPGHSSERQFIRLTPIEEYYQILNVIGVRLRAYPDAILSLAGCASADEPAAIALARAEAVQLYLKNIWGIRPSRLKLETRPPRTNGGSGSAADADPNRSVELSSTVHEVLDPLASDWMMETRLTSPIGLDPSIRAPRGLRSWVITITHKGEEVAKYSSGDSGGGRDLDVNLLLRETESGSPVAPLYAELTVEDSTGNKVTAKDILDFKLAGDVDPLVRSVQVRTVRSFVLRSGDLSSSAAGHFNRELLKEAAETVSDGDRVSIHPLLEIPGAGAIVTEEQMRNEVLHVAGVAQIELGKKNVEIRIDRKAPRYPLSPDLPEYPFLSTMIVVTTEKEIK